MLRAMTVARHAFRRCLPVVPILLALALGACSTQDLFGRGGAPEPADANAAPRSVAPVRTGLVAIAVRVRQEDEVAAQRIAAWANEALSRYGFRPDSTAPATLFLSFERPRTLSARSGPNVGIVGQGGSSSHANIGLSIQIPLGRGEAAPPPAKHEILAELETAPGKVVWRKRAAMDAVPAAEIDPPVARALIGRVIAALAEKAPDLATAR
jgi:hypothetical protein